MNREWLQSSVLLGPNTISNIQEKRFKPRAQKEVTTKVRERAQAEFNDVFVKSLAPGSDIGAEDLAPYQSWIRQSMIGESILQDLQAEFFLTDLRSVRSFGKMLNG